MKIPFTMPVTANVMSIPGGLLKYVTVFSKTCDRIRQNL